ncbi:MAG: S26 family signal peptidase [Tepidisphaeraceae bacterium]|jgi:conjugative transfer signal peptidase TraF
MKLPRLHCAWTASLIGLAALAASSVLFANRQIVINTSPSVPSGLYLRSTAAPAVGQIIDFRIPQAARNYIETRTGQNGEDWYILKPIVAGPGDRVDTTGECLLINGRQIAPMPPTHDTAGRSLPVWRDKRVLAPGEFFVFSDRIPNSFDSRCYGPIPRQQISAVRKALIVW